MVVEPWELDAVILITNAPELTFILETVIIFDV